MKPFILRAAAAALLLSASWVAQAEPYVVTNLEQPGWISSAAWGINNAGTIVGDFATDADDYFQGFILQNGAFTTLAGPAGSTGTHAMGVANDGTVVGSYRDSAGADVGFVYSSGTYTSFQIAGAANTNVRGISADGRYLTGYFDSNAADSQSVRAQGFLLDRTTGALTTFGDATGLTFVQGVNSEHVAVGSEYIPGAFSSSGFTYNIDTGEHLSYQLRNDTGTAFRGINDSGLITGFVGLSGFVGTPESYQLLSVEGGTQIAGEGINNKGLVVGSYLDTAEGRQHAMLATPVPEPADWALMSLGLGIFALSRRLRGAS